MGCSPGATEALGNLQSISEDARNAAGGPRSPEARCCEPLRIESPGNHGLRLQPTPLQPANGAPCFLSAPGIEGAPDIERGVRMGAAMPAHDQIEGMRMPAPALRAKALSIECSRKIGVGGEARRAQFIEQEPQLLGCWREVGSIRHIDWQSGRLLRRHAKIWGSLSDLSTPSRAGPSPLRSAGHSHLQLVLAFNLSSIAVIAKGSGVRSCLEALPSFCSAIVCSVISLLRSPMSGATCPGAAAMSAA